MKSWIITAGLLLIGCSALVQAAEITPLASEPLVRIGSGMSGHIHPSVCLTKQGTIVVIYGQSEYVDLRITRSVDGGRTWSEPVKFGPALKEPFYPGSLTTLVDGRLVHFWNVWYADDKISGGKSRYPAYSISSDDGVTWSEPQSLPKNAQSHSVIRHPLVELSPNDWLVTLTDKTVVYQPQSGNVVPFGDGRNHDLQPMVRTTRGTFVSGLGLRSTDLGKTWQTVAPFPKINTNGWRFDLRALDNGWVLTSEVIGPGVGGDYWRFAISRDDGTSWELDDALTFYNPGRPIGGRACPKTVQLDAETLGTVFYDTDAKQPGGSGVFFLRTPLAKLAPQTK